jgi:chromosome segregation ATPase
MMEPFMPNASFKKPDENEARPLLNFCRLKQTSDQRLQPLIDRIFSRTYLVKDYAAAQRIAKDFNVTAISPDLQVVYAGAFITKVGVQQHKSDRMSALLQIQSL